MVITGKTTIEHWLDADTVSYIKALVLLSENSNNKNIE